MLQIYNCDINSFNFLKDFITDHTVKNLTIMNCNIADDLFIPYIHSLHEINICDKNALNLIRYNPQINILNVYSSNDPEKLTEILSTATIDGFDYATLPVTFIMSYNTEYDEFLIDSYNIYSFDFLIDFYNYHTFKSLSILHCNIKQELVIPRFETLQQLSVIDKDALRLIKNNTQIKILNIYSGYSPAYDASKAEKETPPLKNFFGIEKFDNLEELHTSDPVYDISALSECKNLHSLEIYGSKSIQSLQPLFNLKYLEYVLMDRDAFYALPEDEQNHFNLDDCNTRNAPRVYFFI